MESKKSMDTSTTITTKIKPSWVVIIVFSDLTLKQIYKKLLIYTDSSNDIGDKTMHIDYYHNKQKNETIQTNRSIILVMRYIFDRYKDFSSSENKNDTKFSISEFEIKNFNKPRKNQFYNVFIQLPEELSVKQCRDRINKMMQEIVNFGVLTKKDFEIKIPVENNNKDIHYRRAYINFSESLNPEIKILTYVLIKNTNWYIPVKTGFNSPRDMEIKITRLISDWSNKRKR